MKETLNSQGFIRGLLIVVLIVAILFVGFKFVAPYHRYYALGSQTRDYLRLQTTTGIEPIRKNILRLADEVGVPLHGSNLQVSYNVTSKIVTVKAQWSEVVDFWGYYQKNLNFVMDEEY